MLIRWLSSTLSELDALTLYRMFQLRQNVFVLEQQCLYPDIDALDEHAIHLLGFDSHQALVAYLRILAPGKQYKEPAIGRVLVAETVRGKGVGRSLIDEGVRLSRQHFSDLNIRISAQSHLEALYKGAGFKSVGKAYLEDGIPHQEMLLQTDAA